MKIEGKNVVRHLDLTVMVSGLDPDGDSRRQTVRVHLLVKEKNRTKLNYINNAASALVVGARVLVIALKGLPLPTYTGNPAEDRGLSLPGGGLGAIQVFFNRNFDLTEPLSTEAALVLIAYLGQQDSVECLLWNIASGQVIDDEEPPIPG